MFMQFTCEETPEQSNRKYKHLSKMACIFSFVGVIFSLTFIFIRMSSRI